MAAARRSVFWPLFDLAVRTPRSELRLPREDEFAAPAAIAAGGIHDPATMPFVVPRTVPPTEHPDA